MKNTYRQLMEHLGHDFRDVSLLVQALTHSSYQNEHPESPSYERMEFLGDAVLGFVVSEMLFARYPDLPEGALTACKSSIVGGANLAEVGMDLGLADHVILGHGERRAVLVQPSILADVLEAVIAAVYLDGGIEAARALASRLFSSTVEGLSDGLPVDAKSALQARVLAMRGKLPRYRLVDECGPDHDKTFVFEVSEPGGLSARGSGPSKKAAQQAAASTLLAILEQGASPEPSPSGS